MGVWGCFQEKEKIKFLHSCVSPGPQCTSVPPASVSAQGEDIVPARAASKDPAFY